MAKSGPVKNSMKLTAIHAAIMFRTLRGVDESTRRLGMVAAGLTARKQLQSDGHETIDEDHPRQTDESAPPAAAASLAGRRHEAGLDVAHLREAAWRTSTRYSTT